MTISTVDIGTGVGTVAATSVFATVPSGGVPAGAAIIVGCMEHNTSASTMTVQDTAGNVYTRIDGLLLNGLSANGKQTVFYCLGAKPLSSGNTITYNCSASNTCAISAHYAFNVSAIDATAQGTADGTGFSATSTTQAVSGEELIVFGAWVGTLSGFSQDSNWTDTPPTTTGNGNLVGVLGAKRATTTAGSYSWSPAGSATGTASIVIGLEEAVPARRPRVEHLALVDAAWAPPQPDPVPPRRLVQIRTQVAANGSVVAGPLPVGAGYVAETDGKGSITSDAYVAETNVTNVIYPPFPRNDQNATAWGWEAAPQPQLLTRNVVSQPAPITTVPFPGWQMAAALLAWAAVDASWPQPARATLTPSAPAAVQVMAAPPQQNTVVAAWYAVEIPRAPARTPVATPSGPAAQPPPRTSIAPTAVLAGLAWQGIPDWPSQRAKLAIYGPSVPPPFVPGTKQSAIAVWSWQDGDRPQDRRLLIPSSGPGANAPPSYVPGPLISIIGSWDIPPFPPQPRPVVIIQQHLLTSGGSVVLGWQSAGYASETVPASGSVLAAGYLTEVALVPPPPPVVNNPPFGLPNPVVLAEIIDWWREPPPLAIPIPFIGSLKLPDNPPSPVWQVVYWIDDDYQQPPRAIVPPPTVPPVPYIAHQEVNLSWIFPEPMFQTVRVSAMPPSAPPAQNPPFAGGAQVPEEVLIDWLPDPPQAPVLATGTLPGYLFLPTLRVNFDFVTWPRQRNYVTSSPVPGMPRGNDFPSIDPAEVVTGTWDFGPWLPTGVTIVGINAMSVATIIGADASPASRLVGAPQIAKSPSTGASQCAILQQIGNMIAGVVYRLTASVQTSDGQSLVLYCHERCVVPN